MGLYFCGIILLNFGVKDKGKYLNVYANDHMQAI